MAGGTQTDADIIDGSAFGGAKSLDSFSGTATGSAGAQPNGAELSGLVLDPIEGTATGGTVIIPPTTWSPFPVTQPTGTAVGGATPTPIFWDPAPLFPPAGVAVGGAIPEPVPLPAPVVQPPAGGGAGGAIPAPVALDPVGVFDPVGGAVGGGGAIPIGPPQVPVAAPGGGGGGGAIISPVALDPVEGSPPTGGAIGTDPTVFPLPIPTVPTSPPIGGGGGGSTTTPTAPTGPTVTPPAGGGTGGGGGTPTGPGSVPVTAPTGTGTGTGTTSPTAPTVPVTPPTGSAVGGDASTGVGETLPAQTVTAPTATVETSSTATTSAPPTTTNPVTAPTVSTTTTTSGTTTQTIACKCCGAAADPCCGPFDRTGPYFNRWFNGSAWTSNIVGRGKTTAPERFKLSLSFGNKSSWGDVSVGAPNVDLIQVFNLPFEYYDPGDSVTLIDPFLRFEIARWTNTGPVKCQLLNNYQYAGSIMNNIGNVWLDFESEYLYLLTGYRNLTNAPFQTNDAAHCFVLLSSLENLTQDKGTGASEIADASSYKVFFRRWDPKTASHYGYRYVMKTAQLTSSVLGYSASQLTWVPSINGCPLSITTQGNRSTATPGGDPIVRSVEQCTSTTMGTIPCNSFGASLVLKREQDCGCPNGYAKQLFGPDGLCAGIDLGLGPVELQADLTAYTHVAPYSAASTATPTLPMSLGYMGGALVGSPCSVFAGENLLGYLGQRSENGKNLTYKTMGMTFELQGTGDPIKATVTNQPDPNFYTWTTLGAWGDLYARAVHLWGSVTGGVPSGQLQYVSHTCSPFSMTFSGGLYSTTSPFSSGYTEHIADVEITFTLPSNGIPNQAGPYQATSPNAHDLIQQSKQRLALPCVHRGQPLEESASCGCGGAVLTACSVYGQCRPYGTATDAQVCTRCPDYQAP
jgi:hypothetical protein